MPFIVQLALPTRFRTFVAAGTRRLLLHNCRSASRIMTTVVPGKQPVYCSSDEALRDIESGFSVFVHAAAATPTMLLESLRKEVLKKDLKDIKVHHIHMEGEGVLTSKELSGRVRSNSLFTGQNCRSPIHEGAADFTPIFLSNIPMLFRSPAVEFNMALVQVSPPDEHGYVTLGTSVDCAVAACEKADLIVALINKKMPRTFGDGIMHISHVDYAVNVDQDIYSSHQATLSDEEVKIGKIIVDSLIEDGATLQMGIGSIPTAVMSQITSHKNLGIHSEMVSDPIVDLVLQGIVDNSKKAIHRGKTVSSFCIGTKKLYNFIDNNPAFVMLDCSYTNNPLVVAQNPRVVALNSCIEIDLTGQAVADSIGSKIYSGVGGQLDFIAGAIFSTDGKGKPVLAMPSQTSSKDSKIVPSVKKHAGVTTSRNHVNYVVTEHGIAQLAGKSLRQRAFELIKIASPDHREWLEKSAFDLLKTMPSRD